MAKNPNKRKISANSEISDFEIEMLKFENIDLKKYFKRLKNQYNAVVKQNKMLQKAYLELKEKALGIRNDKNK